MEHFTDENERKQVSLVEKKEKDRRKNVIYACQICFLRFENMQEEKTVKQFKRHQIQCFKQHQCKIHRQRQHMKMLIFNNRRIVVINAKCFRCDNPDVLSIC